MKLELIKQKRVLIVGLGVTGESVVRFLNAHDVAFDVVDERVAATAALSMQYQLDALRNTTMHNTLDADLCCSYDVLVISPGVPRALPSLQAADEKGVQIIGDIELFASAIGDTPVIAVTGSNGKSTVVSWIAHVLDACGVTAKLCGNIGTPALDCIDHKAQLYVLELSSYQLESTSSLKAMSATVLNVSDDHLDRYDSIEDYAHVKRRVYQGCQHAVVNHDDQRTWLHSSETTQANVSNADCHAFTLGSDDAHYHLSDAANDAWLCQGDEQLIRRSQLPTPGEHNVANALAVVALLEPLQLNVSKLVKALANFNGLEHRTELVLDNKGVRWYNDSKGTNIDACSKAVAAMQAPVILIAGGMGKGANFSALRNVVEQHVKALVLIGVDAELMRDALRGTTDIYMASSIDDAVRRCLQLSTEGDVVLLSPACASFDMFDSFEHRGLMFKKAVQEVAA